MFSEPKPSLAFLFIIIEQIQNRIYIEKERKKANKHNAELQRTAPAQKAIQYQKNTLTFLL